MATNHVLLALTLVACLFGASAQNREDFQSIRKQLPFKPWASVKSTWDSSLASPHIIGGEAAKPHSHPHQVGLQITLEDARPTRITVLASMFCGGSLLNERWVVTAAHCIDKKLLLEIYDLGSYEKLRVIAVIGAHNFLNLKPDEVQKILVESIHLHPEWREFPVKNDIALLNLAEDVHLDGKFAKPIRLPSQSQQMESFAGATITMTGWGATSNIGRSGVLQTVDSIALSNWWCKLRYMFLIVKDSNICSSASGGKSPCHGDSGGPMIIREADGNPTLIGITSFSFGCTWGFPAVFTRVTSYLSWIQDTTGILPRI